MDQLIALIILAGGVRKNSRGQWHSTQLSAQDAQWGSPGGQLRVVAASYLYQEFPNYWIIASGGRGWQVKNDEPNRPNLSRIVRDELIELGIPAEKIIEESISHRTYGQLQESGKIIQARKFQSAIVISNLYHLPRIQAMIAADPALSKLPLSVSAAEDILMKRDPQYWQPIIHQAYQSTVLEKIIAAEQQGVQDIKTATYHYGD